MSRQPYQWDKAQILKATRMWYDGVGKRVIAEKVGVSYDTLQFHLEAGELAHLQKRKIGSGKSGNKNTVLDDESKGMLFGLTDWKQRADAIRPWPKEDNEEKEDEEFKAEQEVWKELKE